MAATADCPARGLIVAPRAVQSFPASAGSLERLSAGQVKHAAEVIGSARVTRGLERGKARLPIVAVARAEFLPRCWRARHRPALIELRIARHVTAAGACAADRSARLGSLT